jgi:hypothetical protein
MDVYIDGMTQRDAMEAQHELQLLDFTVSWFYEDDASWLTMVVEDIDNVPFHLDGVIDIFIDDWEARGFEVTYS